MALLIILLALNVLIGVIGYEAGNYITACLNAFAVGYLAATIIMKLLSNK